VGPGAVLKELRIRNFAVVAEMQLALQEGLTVFTGETGVGKSIIVDALGLALGDRGDSRYIRPGQDSAEVIARFAVPAETRAAMREAAGPGGQCLPLPGAQEQWLLHRVLRAKDGRSQAYVNGSPVPLRALRELRARLVEAQGQHAYHSLLARDQQRRMLDAYGEHRELLDGIRECCRQWTQAQRRLQETDGGGQSGQELELLRYQIRELEALQTRAGEYAELEKTHRRLAHADFLERQCRQTLELLDHEEHGAANLLERAAGALREARDLDERLGAATALIEEAALQAREATSGLRRHVEGMDSESVRLQEAEERLGALCEAARKHRIRPEELPERLESLRRRLEDAERGEEDRARLSEEQRRIVSRYRQLAGQLSAERQQAAPRLAREVTGWLRQLGMPNARFEVRVAAREAEQPRDAGWDEVEYQVAVNPGLPPGPLSKVASGGELSRICLALHNCGDRGRASTLVFDEVDVGIRGGVAELVGRLLRKLAENRQVLCITHLPQVASQGHRHLHVQKNDAGGTTRTSVTELDAETRIEEIARMLGGLRITPRTRAHAREMLASA